MASPLRAPPALAGQTIKGPQDETAVSEEADDHLHSVFEVIGCHVDAIDGEIGHVENFLFDNEDWRLRYLIVDTSNWGFGNRVSFPHAVKAIIQSDGQVHLDVSRERVRSRTRPGIRSLPSIKPMRRGFIAITAGQGRRRSPVARSARSSRTRHTTNFVPTNSSAPITSSSIGRGGLNR